MKKFLVAFAIAGIGFIGISPTIAGATKPTKEGFHKVTICHNVSHNPHAISIDVASVAGSTSNKHGDLTLDANLNFVSFVPHNSGGHDQDFYLHNGAEDKSVDDGNATDDDRCKGDTEQPVDVTAFACLNGEISVFGPGEADSVNAELDAFLEANDNATEVDSRDADCPVDETTTTTVPEVTTTTVPEVTTTTTAPAVTFTCADFSYDSAQEFLRQNPSDPYGLDADHDGEACESNPRTGTPVTSTPETPTSLPHTGSNLTLALIGAALLAMGAAAYGVRRFVTN